MEQDKEHPLPTRRLEELSAEELQALRKALAEEKRRRRVMLAEKKRLLEALNHARE